MYKKTPKADGQLVGGIMVKVQPIAQIFSPNMAWSFLESIDLVEIVLVYSR